MIWSVVYRVRCWVYRRLETRACSSPCQRRIRPRKPTRRSSRLTKGPCTSRRPKIYETQTYNKINISDIFRHPLFPLLALLFERCELATQSSDPQSSDAFNMDIQAFVQHQERDRKPFLANEPEIDGLVSEIFKFLNLSRQVIWTTDAYYTKHPKTVREILFFFIDDKSYPSAEDTPSRIRKSSRAMQRLLQPVHYLFERKNAIRESLKIWLSSRFVIFFSICSPAQICTNISNWYLRRFRNWIVEQYGKQ